MVQQVVLSLLFCPDDVRHVEVVDVEQMDEADELLHVDYDVKIHG